MRRFLTLLTLFAIFAIAAEAQMERGTKSESLEETILVGERTGTMLSPRRLLRYGQRRTASRLGPFS